MSSQQNAGAPKGKRPRGRPRREDSPGVPWDVVDALLVFGERIVDPSTGHEAVRFPTHADLARRYGVSNTRMWQYAHRERCAERREEARLKTQARYEAKVIEATATVRATATVDVIRIVDRFLLGFEKELSEGRVKTDSAADFDRMTRLRELVTGGPDSRAELQGGLSLAAIQERHRRQRGQAERLTPELTGTDGGVETPPGGAAASELAGVVPESEVGRTEEKGHRRQRGQAERLTPELTGTDGGVETPPGGAVASELAGVAPESEVGRTEEKGNGESH